MPPILDPEAVKKMVVDALNIGHLTPAEQEKIMNDFGGALIERAMYALLMALTPDQVDQIDQLAEGEKDDEMFELVQKSVPNAQQIVENAIRTGVEEYKQLVNEQIAARTASPTAVQ